MNLLPRITYNLYYSKEKYSLLDIQPDEMKQIIADLMEDGVDPDEITIKPVVW